MSILIACGTLIDGTGRGPVRNARLLVDGDRIVAVGPAETVTAPPGAETIDLSESTVLPGMIEPGERVVDLGGGLGFTAAVVAKAGKAAQVVCVEGHP